MPGDDAFAPVRRELDLWRDRGQQARLWLRDDDAHEPGKQLERLLDAMRRHHAYCLVAVIPMLAGAPLADRLARESLARIAVHGSRHENNALPGERAEEMALALGLPTLRAELIAARERMVSLFGEAAGRWYVPPWNRISQPVAAELPGLGFSAISTFGEKHLALGNQLPEINAHVDFIRWKAGPTGHEAPVIARKLAAELEKARHENFRPIGLLTHHLAHDATVWEVLEQVLALIAAHPGAIWQDPDQLLTSAQKPV